MKHLVIIGAGTGGTILANRMHRRLPEGWAMAVVDPDPEHLYQPGLLLLPFGNEDPARLRRPRGRTLAKGIQWLGAGVSAVHPEDRTVHLDSGVVLPYDLLVVATGARPRPDLLEGLTDDGGAYVEGAHTFYTLEGARRLRDALDRFEGGRLVVDVAETPVKCPVAPLEFLFLADWYFTRKGIRDRVELAYLTPLEEVFTRPPVTKVLGRLLDEKGIEVETEFHAEAVDPSRRVIRGYDDREVRYDLLVAVPVHSGAEAIERSGLGDELGFVEVDPATLSTRTDDHVFALGDASDRPSPKAGSVAYFESAVLAENLVQAMRGESPTAAFDGHASCFVETGHRKGLLVDLDDAADPRPGRYPVSGLGPFALLQESRLNHLGKLAFRWFYWHRILPGRSVPVPQRLPERGRKPSMEAAA